MRLAPSGLHHTVKAFAVEDLAHQAMIAEGNLVWTRARRAVDLAECIADFDHPAVVTIDQLPVGLDAFAIEFSDCVVRAILSKSDKQMRRPVV